MGNDNQKTGRKKFYSANGPFFSANRSAKKKKNVLLQVYGNLPETGISAVCRRLGHRDCGGPPAQRPSVPAAVSGPSLPADAHAAQAKVAVCRADPDPPDPLRFLLFPHRHAAPGLRCPAASPGRVRPRRAAHAGRSAHAQRPAPGKTRDDAPAAGSPDHCRQPRRQGFLPCPPQRTARQGAGSRTQGPGTGPAERGNAPVQNRPQDRPGLPRRHPLCRKHERIPQNPSGRPRRAPYRPLQPQAPLRAA